jgi:hypothetical protein
MKITRAEHDTAYETRLLGRAPTANDHLMLNDTPTGLIHLEFDDGTTWAVYPEATGAPRTYAHDLLDQFTAGGGTVT